MHVRIAVTLAVFAAMIALMVVRPRRWNEAWWTMLAAGTMLALGLVTPREALGSILAGKNTILFLLSLLALSVLIGKSGFFDWAAIRCARIAKGDAHSLYRNAFVAGAIITAILSLDTTAVMLTPILLALVKIGILDYQKLTALRRYMIVINLILGALLTTPEPFTQVVMAVVLQVLFEISVWVAWYWERRDRKRVES